MTPRQTLFSFYFIGNVETSVPPLLLLRIFASKHCNFFWAPFLCSITFPKSSPPHAPHTQNIKKFGSSSIFFYNYSFPAVLPPCHCHLSSFSRPPPSPLSSLCHLLAYPPPYPPFGWRNLWTAPYFNISIVYLVRSLDEFVSDCYGKSFLVLVLIFLANIFFCFSLLLHFVFSNLYFCVFYYICMPSPTLKIEMQICESNL